jgi:hypothetical protein
MLPYPLARVSSYLAAVFFTYCVAEIRYEINMRYKCGLLLEPMPSYLYVTSISASIVSTCPGVHAYNNASFQFRGLASLDSDLIDHGPVKIFIVRSGWVRQLVCVGVWTFTVVVVDMIDRASRVFLCFAYRVSATARASSRIFMRRIISCVTHRWIAGACVLRQWQGDDLQGGSLRRELAYLHCRACRRHPDAAAQVR